ncbi:hypothetical protein CIB48_g5399 [Xylaria polymorpha]|nr:hypothetical protein CIB48_g5399 [Xylaria polymorpha]
MDFEVRNETGILQERCERPGEIRPGNYRGDGRLHAYYASVSVSVSVTPSESTGSGNGSGARLHMPLLLLLMRLARV